MLFKTLPYRMQAKEALLVTTFQPNDGKNTNALIAFEQLAIGHFHVPVKAAFPLPDRLPPKVDPYIENSDCHTLVQPLLSSKQKTKLPSTLGWAHLTGSTQVGSIIFNG